MQNLRKPYTSPEINYAIYTNLEFLSTSKETERSKHKIKDNPTCRECLFCESEIEELSPFWYCTKLSGYIGTKCYKHKINPDERCNDFIKRNNTDD